LTHTVLHIRHHLSTTLVFFLKQTSPRNDTLSCMPARATVRRIRQMRQFVVDDNSDTLVTSRLDYCNNLLAGCGVKVVARLQRV